MASKYWIKLYHEILDDPKMGRLTDRLWRRTIELLLMAGDTDEGGYLPDVKDIAWRMRANIEETETELYELAEYGILSLKDGNWLVTNFASRQMPMNSSERARRWRKKYKNTYWAVRIYKRLPASPGIYRIICTENGKSYIGAAHDIRARMKQNLYTMTTEEHPMFDDFVEYGPESIEVEILESDVKDKELSEREIYWHGQFDEAELYNKRTPFKHIAWDEERIENENRTKRSREEDIDIDKITDIEEDKDKDCGHIYTLFENEIQMLSKYNSEIVGEWIDTYPSEWIEDAIKEAVLNNARKPNYVSAILMNWKNEGRHSKNNRKHGAKDSVQSELEQMIKEAKEREQQNGN